MCSSDLTNARVIDGTGRAPMERATVVISDGRIQAVGPTVAVPPGATRVDLAGKTVMPGLVNAHGHLNADTSNRPTRDKLIGQLKLYADYGVTSVQVLGIGLDAVTDAINLRDEQATGPLDRARVFVAAQSLRDLKSEADARMWVNNYADRRVDIIKLHIPGGPNDMTPAVYGALIDQAHQRGLRVAAHLFYLRDAKGLLEKGVDVIAHSIRDQAVDQATIDAIKARNVGYIPTLTRDLAQFVYESTPDFFKDPFFLRHADAYRRDIMKLSDAMSQEKMRTSPDAQAIKTALQQGSRNLKTLDRKSTRLNSSHT